MGIFQRISGDYRYRYTIFISIIGCVGGLIIGSVYIYMAYSLKDKGRDETDEETKDRDDKKKSYIMIGSSLWVLSILILLVGIIYYYAYYKGGTRKQTRIKNNTRRFMPIDILLDFIPKV